MSQTLQSLLVQRAMSPNRRKEQPQVPASFSSQRLLQWAPCQWWLAKGTHKFREARVKRYNYFINFTFTLTFTCEMWNFTFASHPGHPQDGVFLQVTHSRRVDKLSEVTKICEQNWASIWGLCFQEIHWSRLINLPWKSTLFWCWVWNLLFTYSLAHLHSTPPPPPHPLPNQDSFQDSVFS